MAVVMATLAAAIVVVTAMVVTAMAAPAVAVVAVATAIMAPTCGETSDARPVSKWLTSAVEAKVEGSSRVGSHHGDDGRAGDSL